MIDIHTHILPGIDDGSKNVEESIAMLKMMANQGVDTIVATPHFYINRLNIESFFDKRDEAAHKLFEGLRDIENRPRIALAAEVEFYNELHSLDDLEKLCINGTKYILVEMPFVFWTDYTYQSLEYLSMERGITPIIAHIERYIDMQKDNVIDKLVEANALVQINSSFVLGKGTRKKALNMIKNGMVCYIGSDCHNLTTRPPEIKLAYDAIEKKLGRDAIESLEFWENRLKEDLKTF